MPDNPSRSSAPIDNGRAGRFEWHITLDQQHRSTAQKIADAFGFTFSEITGCPILGQGTYCYITGFDTNSEIALSEVNTVLRVLVTYNVPVLRAKIEDIVYDTKTNVDRLGPDGGRRLA